MLRYALIALAAFVLVCASLVPDDALARRGGGGVRAGGFHGGGARAAHFGGGAVHAGRIGGVAGRGYGYGRPVARAAVRGGAYGTAAYRGAWRRPAYGAAALGAAAAGAAYYGGYGGYYNSGCYRDAYGYQVCPNQYPY